MLAFNVIRNLFQFLLFFSPPSHLWYARRNFPSHEKLTCCNTQVIFLKRFSYYFSIFILFLFNFWWITNYTSLTWLYCAMFGACWMVLQLFEICLPNLRNWVCIKYFFCYPVYKIQGVPGMKFLCYSHTIHSIHAV